MNNKFDDALAKTAQKDLSFKSSIESSIEKASKLVEAQQTCIKDLDFFKVSASEAAMQNIENLTLISAKAEAALKDSFSAAMKAIEPHMACLKQADLISQASNVADAMKPFESIIEQRNIINNLFASAEQIRSKFSSANITNVFEEQPFLNAYSDILSDFVVSAKPIYDTTSDEDIVCSDELDDLATKTLSDIEKTTKAKKHSWNTLSTADKTNIIIKIILFILSLFTSSPISINVDNSHNTYNSVENRYYINGEDAEKIIRDVISEMLTNADK